MPFAVPGKVPLYLEDASLTIGEETEDVIGLELRGGEARAFFISGCARLTPALAERLRGAALVMFDGTLWVDDEMVRGATGVKTGSRMGHMSVSGPDGSLAAFASLGVRRKILIHINNTNPVSSMIRPSRRRSRRPAGRWLTTAWRSACDRCLDPGQLEAELRQIGDERYHWNHPFHIAMKNGELSKPQVQAWALNRYYYQSHIPMKDAAIMARMEEPALRLAWRQRIIDHDGERAGEGGSSAGCAWPTASAWTGPT